MWAIYHIVECYILTDNTHTDEKNIIICLKLTAPSQGYKLNSDGSSMGSTSQGGTSGVIRNSKGEWVVGYMDNLYMANNRKAKLICLLQGLCIALEKGLLP